MDFLLAQAVPPTQVPTEWWVPLIAALLVAAWDIIKRKFNLVEPVQPTPEIVTPVVVPPAPQPSPQPAPEPTPVLDIIKQLLPVLIPQILQVLKSSKSDAEKT